jgi:hypothetical protein
MNDDQRRQDGKEPEMEEEENQEVRELTERHLVGSGMPVKVGGGRNR